MLTLSIDWKSLTHYITPPLSNPQSTLLTTNLSNPHVFPLSLPIHISEALFSLSYFFTSATNPSTSSFLVLKTSPHISKPPVFPPLKDAASSIVP
jgi:hypothetical protein